jgi:hypothetical protein
MRLTATLCSTAHLFVCSARRRRLCSESICDLHFISWDWGFITFSYFTPGVLWCETDCQEQSTMGNWFRCNSPPHWNNQCIVQCYNSMPVHRGVRSFVHKLPIPTCNYTARPSQLRAWVQAGGCAQSVPVVFKPLVNYLHCVLLVGGSFICCLAYWGNL